MRDEVCAVVTALVQPRTVMVCRVLMSKNAITNTVARQKYAINAGNP